MCFPLEAPNQFSPPQLHITLGKSHCAAEKKKGGGITKKERIYFTVKYLLYSIIEVSAASECCIFSAEHARAIDKPLVLYVPRCMNYYCRSPFYTSSSIAYSNAFLLAVGDYKGPLAMVVIDQAVFSVCLPSNGKMS